ncbi:DUF2891 domain-containing protein [Derxia lacustris]|uniref:DUF2891 domain-containing protein n=1 Tax=Derxia lacustris TaxID=764842 RepID=UPI000A170EFE|nr:DUF2891 domain-containing protein [Derxia lacustris]
MYSLTSEIAALFARIALDNLATHYPWQLSHVLDGPADVRPPEQLHPAFHTSFDWHSCIHMHWLLVSMLRRNPRLACAREAVARLDASFAPTAIAGEIAYLRGPHRSTFGRPYGWAWLFRLATELERFAQREVAARGWAAALAPLVEEIADRLRRWLPQATWPVREGGHGNSAFLLLAAMDWASVRGDDAFASQLRDRGLAWFGTDKHYPARYEPSGEDFLSPGLVEALLMQRLLGAPLGFQTWWREFCPKGDDLVFWLQPPHLAGDDDPRLVHLDGLLLSRAWCLRRLAPDAGPQSEAFARAAEAHLHAAMPRLEAGGYARRHWIASFALLALDD